MPGLVGIVSENVVDEQLSNRMVDSIKHEEFYQVNKYINLHFGIARVHLGVFNPEPQPIFNEDKSLCIFMDGKIYDYGEQLNELKNRGHRFNSENDPEFCLHSYEEYGKDFVKILNGSFVFVICDLKENKTVIVNDRYGLRPLYYTINNEKLLFASEVKAILEDRYFIKELDDDAIADFFAFGEILGNKTFFKGIEVLPTASIAVWDGKLSIEQYWDFNYEPDYSKSEDEFVDELVKNFNRAVEIRLEDNLRYGVSLSGGLDSRVVVGAIDKNKREDILTLTFGQLDCDEVKIAKKVSDAMGTKFKTIEITPEMIIENAEKETYLWDGLNDIGMSYIIPVYQEMMTRIDVLFDGFALDLTLGGSYLTKKMASYTNKKKLVEVLLNNRMIFSEDELKMLLNPEYYNKAQGLPQKHFIEIFNSVSDRHPLNRVDHIFLKTHVAYITIQNSMIINFAEIAQPTTDNDFVDLILTIPPELRLNHRIYRKFLKKLSPELSKIPYNKTMVRADAPLILWRIGATYQFGKEKLKKLIFNLSKGKIFLPNTRGYVNFDEWLQANESWKSYFQELLLDEKSVSKIYINQNFIKSLLQDHVEGNTDNTRKLIYLASFELFLRLFVKDSSK